MHVCVYLYVDIVCMHIHALSVKHSSLLPDGN